MTPRAEHLGDGKGRSNGRNIYREGPSRPSSLSVFLRNLSFWFSLCFPSSLFFPLLLDGSTKTFLADVLLFFFSAICPFLLNHKYGGDDSSGGSLPYRFFLSLSPLSTVICLS
ncbi:hypothetical protein HN51_035230 [Arachis hypogaea]|nr:uncharacterized protein DS421_13g404810 [Arachis hypogaea]